MSRPPYLYSDDQSKQSSWGEDFANSPGKALLRTTRLGLSEQGPNPKGYANETPLLLFKCLIYITIGGFRHRQVPREFPAQIRPSVFSTQLPPGKIPRHRPDILIQQAHLHKSAPFSVPREYFFFRMQIGIQFHFPPLSAQPSSTLKLHLEYKGASFERHFLVQKSPGKALLRTSSHFGPQPPPGQLVRRGPPNFI